MFRLMTEITRGLAAAQSTEPFDLLQNLFRSRDQLGIEIEYFFDVFLQLGAVEGVDVELGFGGVGEKLRIFHVSMNALRRICTRSFGVPGGST